MREKLICTECGRKYYTARSEIQIRGSEGKCEECGGELEICEDNVCVAGSDGEEVEE